MHMSGSGACAGLSILRLVYGPGVPSFHRFSLPFVLPCRGARGSQAVSRRSPHWTVSQALIPQPNKNILNIRIAVLQSEENSVCLSQHPSSTWGLWLMLAKKNRSRTNCLCVLQIPCNWRLGELSEQRLYLCP